MLSVDALQRAPRFVVFSEIPNQRGEIQKFKLREPVKGLSRSFKYINVA